MDAFGYKHIEHLFGVKRTRLAQWQKRGWIPAPSIQKAGTPGRANLYSRKDVYRIGLFSYFVMFQKIHCERAADLLSQVSFEKNKVRRFAGVPFGGSFYQMIGKYSRPLKANKELSVFEVNVKGFRELVDLWIERLPKE